MVFSTPQAIILSVLLPALTFFGSCAVFQWLWNSTVPQQFGLKPLRYWVAFKLLLIAAILFSGGLLRVSLPFPSPQTVTVGPAQ